MLDCGMPDCELRIAECRIAKMLDCGMLDCENARLRKCRIAECGRFLKILYGSKSAIRNPQSEIRLLRHYLSGRLRFDTLQQLSNALLVMIFYYPLGDN